MDMEAGKIASFGNALLEVLNVKISKKMEFYGIFSVTDREGTVYLFNRKSKDTEPVEATDVLPLHMPERLIRANGPVIFSLHLVDKDGRELIKGSSSLFVSEENPSTFDKYLVAQIDGTEGFANVYYTIPINALKAGFEIKLIHNIYSIGFSNVVGSIVASYADDYDNSIDNDIKKNIWFTLYEQTSGDKPLQLIEQYPLPLLRQYVIAPARCSLVIKMDLLLHHSNGQTDKLTDYQFQFPACECDPSYEVNKLEREYGPINKETKLECVTLKTSLDFVPPRFDSINMDLKAGKIASFGNALLEVFSVRLSKKLEFYGIFSVTDREGTVYLFKRKSKDTESVEATDVLPLRMPERLIRANGTVIFSLHLVDKHGCELIKGSSSLFVSEENTCNTFDKYLVAQIDGTEGFAKVYYTIPTNALNTGFEIKLIHNDNGIGFSNVVGSIFASYADDYDNSIGDDMKKNIWFTLYEKTSRDKPLRLIEQYPLPLLRQYVFAPARCSLVIKMDLVLHHSNGQTDKLTDYQFQFPACACDPSYEMNKLECEYAPIDEETKLECVTLKTSLDFVPPRFFNFDMVWDMDLEYDMYKDGTIGSVGSAVVEVLNVRISDKMEVYGTFSIKDHKGTVDLFNRMPENTGTGSVKATEVLPLCKPPRAIQATGTVIFSIYLLDNSGHELINGSFSVDFTKESIVATFDKYLVGQINGNKGFAKVYYTIPTVAVESNLNIRIFHVVDGVGHSDVNGTIVARYENNYDDCVDEQTTWVTLFDKTPNDKPLLLEDKDFVPLSRCGIIVPGQSSLLIKMNLVLQHSNGTIEKLRDYQIQFRPNEWCIEEKMLGCVTLRMSLSCRLPKYVDVVN